MQRRQFLATAGIGAVSTVSGCLGDEPMQSSPPDELNTDVEVESKEEGPAIELVDLKINEYPLTYTDEFSMDIVLANVGDELITEISLAGTLFFRVGFLDPDGGMTDTFQLQSAKVRLEPGETSVVTVGPIRADASGPWRITSDDVAYIRDGATTEFEVNPMHVSLEDDLYNNSLISISVEQFHIFKSFFYEYITDRTGHELPSISVSEAPEGHVYVVPEVTLTNSVVQRLYFTQNKQKSRYHLDQVDIPPGEKLSHDTESTRTAELPGTYLGDSVVKGGETATAWLTGVVPIEKRDEIAFEFRRWYDQGPPDAYVEIGDTRFPQFELTEYIIPAHQEGEQRIGVVVRNVGDVTGEYRGVVQHTAGDRKEFVDPISGGELRVTLDPGSSASVAVLYDHEPGTCYRFLPSGETFEV